MRHPLPERRLTPSLGGIHLVLDRELRIAGVVVRAALLRERIAALDKAAHRTARAVRAAAGGDGVRRRRRGRWAGAAATSRTRASSS